MKSKFYTLAITLLSALTMNGQEIISTSFSSNSLNGETIPLNIYLPQDYDENGAPYNLYIFLHGCCGLDHDSHINAFESKLNQLIGNGSIDPLIVVFPSAQGADFGNRHAWFNSERNGQYADLISVDLLDWLATNYNVSEVKRAVGGFSMGGDGALRIGLNDSDKFLAVVSHSSIPDMDYLLELNPLLINETGQSEPPYTYIPIPGSLTERAFGTASAYSPNIDNPNYQLDFLLDKNGQTIDSVFLRWKVNADVDTILRINWGITKEVPLSIYFDIGTNEFLYPSNEIANTQLNNLVQNENYQINYKYLEFLGGHVLTGSKIDSALIWLNQVFTNVTTSNQEVKEFQDPYLSVFPNPTNGAIKIKYKKKNNAKYLIQAIDINGKIVESKVVQGVGNIETDINLSNHENGIYQILIRDESNNKLIVKRVIKM